ncbi:MAG: 2-alkenal reductase, partial [Polaromonas sp. 39-63-203]
MKRTWLLFSQAVTVLVAAWFVVATLQPQWLGRGSASIGGVSVIEAPASSVARSTAPGGSFSAAAKIASPAVVSINTSKAAATNPYGDDPWFKFFFGDQGKGEPQGGLGSGVIISTTGYILTNNHVVEGADQIEVILNDTRKAKARVIGTDPDTDLAILKI